MTRNGLMGVLLAPPITGMRAIGYTILAVAIPTLIRLAVTPIVSGCEFGVFLPFILMTAIFMGWKHAAAAAVASAAIAKFVIMGSFKFSLESCDTYSVGILLLASTAVIGVVHAFRRVISGCFEPLGASDFSNGGVVFSLEDEKAWASWYGKQWPVQLGPEEEVAEMMEDFLAQKELGKRLADPRAVAMAIRPSTEPLRLSGIERLPGARAR